MDRLAEVLNAVDSFIWGPFLLIPLLLGTGLWLTIRLRGLQFRRLAPALRLAFKDRADEGVGAAHGDISQYQALTTALAATVGTGNIVGVATAISVGGPGALFWMWVTGLLGMASKYAEAFLAVRFRHRDVRGEVTGGPQYYLKRGISGPVGKTLAVMFAVFAVIASFGIGNLTQANAVATNLENVRRLQAAGVKLGFGTDAGAMPHRVIGVAEHRELQLLVQAGLSPAQALQVATSQAADLLGLADRGRIAAGKRADLLVLDADPLTDIANTQRIGAVWQAGQEVAGPITE